MNRPGVMIFAAGRGTRMRHLTTDRPKPLVEVGGRPLIDHTLDIARHFAPAAIVANTHVFGDQIARHLAGSEVCLSHEERLLDTGGGLKAARAMLPPGPVMTLNADALWSGPNPLETLFRAWDGERMDALLLLLAPEARLGHLRDGDFSIGDGGRLRRGGAYTYSGAQIIRPEVLDEIGDEVFSLNRAWDLIEARGRLCGCLYDGRWCDVGQPESIPIAEGMLADG